MRDGEEQQKTEDQEDTFLEDVKEIEEREKKNSPPSPSAAGEEEISGSNPNPDSDDDTLEASHQVGLRPKEDLEHPKELNIGKDVNEAEEYKRKH